MEGNKNKTLKPDAKVCSKKKNVLTWLCAWNTTSYKYESRSQKRLPSLSSWWSVLRSFRLQCRHGGLSAKHSQHPPLWRRGPVFFAAGHTAAPRSIASDAPGSLHYSAMLFWKTDAFGYAMVIYSNKKIYILRIDKNSEGLFRWPTEVK